MCHQHYEVEEINRVIWILSRIYDLVIAGAPVWKQVVMMVKGYERRSCVAPQNWITWYSMCHVWPWSDTKGLLKHSQSGSKNVQTQVLDENQTIFHILS